MSSFDASAPDGLTERTAPKPPLGGFVGGVASVVYGAAIGWKNRRFDAGKGVVTFDRP